jgi:hypothetical protein
MNRNTEILLITWSKYRNVHFNLAMFYNICLFYDNVVTFYTYDMLDVSRVTVWLNGLNEWMNKWMNEWMNNNNYYNLQGVYIKQAHLKHRWFIK